MQDRFANLTDDKIRELLLHGECYGTAIALGEALGWPVGGILADWEQRYWLPHLAHAYVVAPDGRLLDASGLREPEEVWNQYFDHRNMAAIRNPRFADFGTPEEFRIALRKLYMGASDDPAHRYYDPDFDDSIPTEYDRYLDDILPSIREIVCEKIDVMSVVRDEYEMAVTSPHRPY